MDSTENYSRIIYYTSSATSQSKSTYPVSAVPSSTFRRPVNYSQDKINAEDYYTPAEEIESDYDVYEERARLRSRLNETGNGYSIKNNQYIDRNVYDIFAIQEQLEASRCFEKNQVRKVSLHTENKIRDFAKEVEFAIQQNIPKHAWKLNDNKINIKEQEHVEKTTYCRPVKEYNNEEFIFKTLENKKKLQSLVENMITARAKEKQRAAWDNYINQLRRKHATIGDSQPKTSKALHSPNIGINIERLDDYYKTKFSTAPSNHCKNLLHDLYNSSIDADKFPIRSYAKANIFFDNNYPPDVNAMNSQNTSNTTAANVRNINNLTLPFSNKLNPYLGVTPSSNGTQSPFFTYPCSSVGRLMKQRAHNSCDLGTPNWRLFDKKSHKRSVYKQYYDNRKNAMNKAITENTRSTFKPKRTDLSYKRTSDQDNFKPLKLKKNAQPRQIPEASYTRTSDQDSLRALKPKKYAPPRQISDHSPNRTSDRESFKPKSYNNAEQISEFHPFETSYQDNSKAFKPKTYNQRKQMSDLSPNRTNNQKRPKEFNKPKTYKHSDDNDDYGQLLDSNPKRRNNRESFKPKSYNHAEQTSDLSTNRASDRETAKEPKHKKYIESQQLSDPSSDKTSDRETPKEPKHKKYVESQQLSGPSSDKTSDQESIEAHKLKKYTYPGQTSDSISDRTSDKENSKAQKPYKDQSQKTLSTQANDLFDKTKENKINQTTENETKCLADGIFQNIEQKLGVLIKQMNSLLTESDKAPVFVKRCCKSVGCSQIKPVKPCCRNIHNHINDLLDSKMAQTFVKPCCRNIHKPHINDLLDSKTAQAFPLNVKIHQNHENPNVHKTNIESRNQSSTSSTNTYEDKDNKLDDNMSRSYKESHVNASKIDEILLEEMDKSDKAKQDIEGILNGDLIKSYESCGFNFALQIPTKECCTEVTHSLSLAKIKEDSSVESRELVEIYPNRTSKQLTMAAVNTDPLSFLALLQISTATIGRLLSFVHFAYQSLLPLPMPRPMVGYNCSICDSSFLKSTDLSEHIRAHKKLPSKDCCVCRHMLEVTRTRPRKLFKCRYCNKNFTRAYCCELHQQNCAQKQGQEHDVPENLSILS